MLLSSTRFIALTQFIALDHQDYFAMTSLNTLSRFSTADLITRVGIALTLQRDAALRNLDFSVQHTEVKLSGTVLTESQRQLAITVVSKIAGVTHVVNAIAVQEPAVVPHNLQSPKEPKSPALLMWQSIKAIAAATLSCGFLLTQAGCSTEQATAYAAIQGQITYNGQPLSNAFVVLHPKTAVASQVPARGMTDTQGNFKASVMESQQVLTDGEYLVTVQHFPLVNGVQGKNHLSPKIAHKETTDIQISLKPALKVLPPIEVQR
jgi:BON domain